MTELVATLSGVQKRLGDKRVLTGVDLSIAKGSVLGLLGRNGAGKTTLIQCLLGLRECDQGAVSVFGETPADLSAASKGRIGYVPQQADLFDWMTPLEMLGFMRLHYPRWNQAKVDALLDRWRIDTRRMISNLSVGERQRLAIIRALAHDPDLLVLDEPVASLDPAARRDFLRELVEGTLERQTTVLFSTHILSDLERVAIDIAILHEGRVVLQGAMDELSEEVVRLTGSPEALGPHLANALTEPVEVGDGQQCITVRMARSSAPLEPAVRQDRMGIEDLFIEVTR